VHPVDVFQLDMEEPRKTTITPKKKWTRIDPNSPACPSSPTAAGWSPVQKPSRNFSEILSDQVTSRSLTSLTSPPLAGASNLSCSPFTLEPALKRDDKVLTSTKRMSQKDRKRSLQSVPSASASLISPTTATPWKAATVKVSLLEVQQEEVLFKKTELASSPRASLLTQTYHRTNVRWYSQPKDAKAKSMQVIQKEENAKRELKDFYSRTSNVLLGEWITIRNKKVNK
jgi:hypothetical protein